MGGIPLVAANLASLSISGFLYGLFFVLFCGSSFLMARRRRQAKSRSLRTLSFFDPQFVTGILILITITAHWTLIVYRSSQAFTSWDGTGSVGGLYGDLSQATYVATTALRFGAQRCADVLRVFRLCVVWSENRYVKVAVSSCFLATVGCDIAALYFLTRYDAGEDVLHSTAGMLIVSDTVLTICTNISCCTFIISRLWHTDCQVSDFRVQRDGIPGRASGTLMWLLSIFAENATIYMISIIAFFVSFLVKSSIQYPFADFLAPISGIAFMLINIRVGVAYLGSDDDILNLRNDLGTYERSVSGRRAGHSSFAMAPIDLDLSDSMMDEGRGSKRTL